MTLAELMIPPCVGVLLSAAGGVSPLEGVPDVCDFV